MVACSCGGLNALWFVLQVKKMYRKACLSVHPDKVNQQYACISLPPSPSLPSLSRITNYYCISFQAQDTDHEILARAIFDELNDAYTRFEESGAQPLF